MPLALLMRDFVDFATRLIEFCLDIKALNMGSNLLTSIKLHQFEVEQLQQYKHLVIVRPIEPQPTGNSLDSSLDGEWLDKPFKINKQPLLLPTIADLPRECP
jgi:hypothetical protein